MKIYVPLIDVQGVGGSNPSNSTMIKNKRLVYASLFIYISILVLVVLPLIP